MHIMHGRFLLGAAAIPTAYLLFDEEAEKETTPEKIYHKLSKIDVSTPSAGSHQN